MGPTVSSPARTRSLPTALAAYKADFANMPPSLQPEAYELVEQDLQTIRCLVTNSTPAVKERWRSLVDAHVSLTGAMLGNFLAIEMGHVTPVSEADLARLRNAHASAVRALGAVQMSADEIGNISASNQWRADVGPERVPVAP